MADYTHSYIWTPFELLNDMANHALPVALWAIVAAVPVVAVILLIRRFRK